MPQTLKDWEGNMAQIEDEQTINALDKIFNAWLASHGMLTKGGTLYFADSLGEIALDTQGTPRSANSEQFKLLLLDPEKGLRAYAARQGIRLKPDLQDFPEE